jgi:hypothetical protein
VKLKISDTIFYVGIILKLDMVLIREKKKIALDGKRRFIRGI